jgi:tetratricopeptide (TPR) repeat protein
MDSVKPQMPRRRLGSWKEIAFFFGRDERTVRRWEKQRGMPVHRLPGGERGGVYAFTDQLAEWQRIGNFTDPEVDVEIPDQDSAEDLSAESPPAVGLPGASAPMDRGTLPRMGVAGGSGASAVPSARSAPGPGALSGFRLKTGLIFGAAVLTLLVSGTVIERRFSEPIHPVVNAASSRPADPEAAALYLKGRYYWNKRTPEDLNTAVGYFTQSIVRDSNYAPAYVGLADSYNLLGEFSATAPGETRARAYAAARKAVELDDSSAHAHAALAFATLYWKWDQPAAQHEFQRAIALDPRDAQTRHWYATSLIIFGRPEESLRQIDVAQSLDPSSKAILADKGLLTYYWGRREAGLAILKQLEISDPSFVSSHRYLAEMYRSGGDYTNYLAEQKQVALLLHDQQELAIVGAAKRGLGAGGYRGMLEAMLPLQEKFYSQGTVSAYSLATTLALLGRKKDSLQYLEAAYDQRESRVLTLKYDFVFDGMRDDPAFQTLQARVNGGRPD